MASREFVAERIAEMCSKAIENLRREREEREEKKINDWLNEEIARRRAKANRRIFKKKYVEPTRDEAYRAVHASDIYYFGKPLIWLKAFERDLEDLQTAANHRHAANEVITLSPTEISQLNHWSEFFN